MFSQGIKSITASSRLLCTKQVFAKDKKCFSFVRPNLTPSTPQGNQGKWSNKLLFFGLPLLAAVPLIGQYSKHEDVVVPGEHEKTKTRIGETIAGVVQSHTPMREFSTHLSSIECESGNMDKQITVHNISATLTRILCSLSPWILTKKMLG